MSIGINSVGIEVGGYLSPLTTLTKSYDVNWSIYSKLTESYTLKWSITNKIYSSYSVNWSMYNKITKDAELKWGIGIPDYIVKANYSYVLTNTNNNTYTL